MEVADDIAYCTSDLEDGIEKGVVEDYHLERELSFYEVKEGPVDSFIKSKTTLINEAVEETAQSFVDNIDKVLRGQEFAIMDDDKPAGAKIKEIKSFAKKYIYTHCEVERIELAGNSAITGILKHFERMLNLSEIEFKYLINRERKEIVDNALQFDAHLFNILPDSYVEKYKLMLSSSYPEMRAREHLVVDFISGMTDDFAIHTYQVLQGIKVR